MGRGGGEAGGEDGGGRGGARVRVVGLGTVVHGVVARVEEGVEDLPFQGGRDLAVGRDAAGTSDFEGGRGGWDRLS